MSSCSSFSDFDYIKMLLLDLFKQTPKGFSTADLKEVSFRFQRRGGYSNYPTSNSEIQKAFKELIAENKIKKAGITGTMNYIYSGDNKEDDKPLGIQIITFYF